MEDREGIQGKICDNLHKYVYAFADLFQLSGVTFETSIILTTVRKADRSLIGT